jgi:hypothetical protein
MFQISNFEIPHAEAGPEGGVAGTRAWGTRRVRERLGSARNGAVRGANPIPVARAGRRAAETTALRDEHWAWVLVTFLPRKRGAPGQPGKASRVVAETRAWGTRTVQGRFGSGQTESDRRPAVVRRFSSSRTLSGRRAIVGFIIMFSITVGLRVPASPEMHPRFAGLHGAAARRAKQHTGVGCGPNRLSAAVGFAGARRTKFFVTGAKIARGGEKPPVSGKRKMHPALQAA